MGKVVSVLTSPISLISKKAGKIVSGIALTIAGIYTMNPALIAAGVSRAASALAKTPRVSPATGDRLYASIDGGAYRKSLFGNTALGTDVRYQAYTGTDQEYYEQIVVVASHKVAAIDSIYLEQKLAWTSGGGVASGFTGYLTVTPILEGSAANAIDIDAVWNAANKCRLTGCAYVRLRYKLTGNSKKAESPFSASIPSRMTIVGKGMPVYDPRRDSTAGGSGSMRAADQSTWAYSVGGDDIGRNGALVELAHLLGWRINGKLAVGRGVPANRIDLSSFIDAANLCDEAVTLAAGGTEPRYRIDGIFSEGDDGGTVRGSIEGGMNADLIERDGRLALMVWHNDLAVPALTLSEDDIVGDVVWNQTGPLNDDRNIVRGRFVDPGALYQMADYPAIVTESPDAIDRILPLDQPVVQSPGQVQRLAKQKLQRLKYPGTFTAPFNARGWAAQKGKVIALDFAPLGWAGKLFRVEDQEIDVSGVTPLTLVEESAALYAWDREEAPAVVPAVPTTYDYLNNPMIGAGDGLSIREITVYRRSATAPATPSGGSFDFTTRVFTPPSGWSQSWPTAGTDPVYAASGYVYVQGITGTATPTWLGVGQAAANGATGADGQATNVIFRTSATQPATPAPSAGVPAGWYDSTDSVPASDDPTWASFGTRPDSTSSYTWQAGKLVEGVNGRALSVVSSTLNFLADYTGALKSGQVPRTNRAILTDGGVDRSADGSVTWSVPSGQQINCSVSIDADGLTTVSAVTATGSYQVQGLFAGFAYKASVEVVVSADPAPPSTSTGQTTTTITVSATSSYPSTITAGILTVLSDASGNLTYNAGVTYDCPHSGATKNAALQGKPVYRLAGSGAAWTDMATNVTGSAATWNPNGGGPGEPSFGSGTLSMSGTASMPAANTAYEVAFIARNVGSSTATNVAANFRSAQP